MNQSVLSVLTSLSTVVIFIYGKFWYLLRKVGIIKKIQSSALILPPAAPGSLGDEAMVVASQEYLHQQNITQVGIVAYNIKLNYPIETIEAINLRDYLLFSSWWAFFQKIIYFGYKVSRYETFYCFGADLMDGYYSDYATIKKVKLVELAARAGLNCAILGFSFNDKPTPIATKILQNLPPQVKLCARDPVSQKRLTANVQRPIKLVADLAFLLCPIETSEKVKQVHQWIDRQHELDRLVIGVNPNNLLIKDLQDQTTEDLVWAYVNNLVKLYSRNHQLSFLLVPHDFRRLQNKQSDNNLSNLILEALPAELKPYLFKIPAPCTAAEIKAIVGHLDLVLSSRMHLAISCLSQAVPVICVAYQGKFEGLFQHFSLDNMNITPADLLQADSSQLLDRLTYLIENRKQIHQNLQSKLPEVIQLAQANFYN